MQSPLALFEADGTGGGGGGLLWEQAGSSHFKGSRVKSLALSCGLQSKGWS